ncbi:MAG: tetratricopeptide repeat protein, partial [Deltaproteobacteria bacterium]|nr:tetratricopeptide repeat protein [Deltaproteobacteria bacterium]
KQAEWSETPTERRALLAQVAALEESRLTDRAAAIATWRDVLADHPTDGDALNALERLYEGAEKWRELIEVLRRKVDQLTATGEASPEVKQLLGRVAEIHEVMLEDPEEAIAAYLEIVDHAGSAGDPQALVELARLYRAGQRYADLLDILERQAAALSGPARTQLVVEIAQLLAGPLGRTVDALERWSEVLRDEPEHPIALAAVEHALGDPDLRPTAAEILRPIYEATGQHQALATLLLRIAEWTDEPGAKLRALGEVVRLREYQLGDKPGAFAAQVMALRHAAAEPELARVVAETERLAGELGRENDLIDAYREVAPNVLDAEIQRRLYLDVADLARAVRRDLNLARDYYQKVLDGQPDDRRALIALESIYRETDDDDRLTEVLLRQADVAGSDVDDRVGALVEAAGLYAQRNRPDDAIATWEQVLAVAPERRDAVQALEALYREQGRWPDVVDLYERRLGFATSVEEAVTLQVQLGEIHEVHLRDLETAIDNYSAALSGDPRHVAALAAVERYLLDPDIRAVAAEVLEPIYVGQHRWTDLIRVYEARLEGTTDPRDRLKLTRFVARLFEEQLEDFENASKWYARVFVESPSDPAIRDQLQRLASIVDNWAFVAETYQRYLDEEAGDSPDLREVAIAAATIYDRRLGAVDQAYLMYRRALGIDSEGSIPDERELIRRLEDLLGRAQRWPELVTIYEDTIQRAGDDLRREALTKRARLVEDGLGDGVRAVDGWREVMVSTEGSLAALDQHAYRESVVELERLYRKQTRWTDLVELFEARLTRALSLPAQAGLAEAAELRLKLAELHEVQREDITAALDQYEQIIVENRRWEAAVTALERLVVHEQHRERIAELLEPVYRKQDWWQKLVVILDAKLVFIRDPMDQIMTLHEIAEIHELRGGALDLALEALARAWRIDVADE